LLIKPSILSSFSFFFNGHIVNYNLFNLLPFTHYIINLVCRVSFFNKRLPSRLKIRASRPTLKRTLIIGSATTIKLQPALPLQLRVHNCIWSHSKSLETLLLNIKNCNAHWFWFALNQYSHRAAGPCSYAERCHIVIPGY
jgi:hypothetical protein